MCPLIFVGGNDAAPVKGPELIFNLLKLSTLGSSYYLVMAGALNANHRRQVGLRFHAFRSSNPLKGDALSLVFYPPLVTEAGPPTKWPRRVCVTTYQHDSRIGSTLTAVLHGFLQPVCLIQIGRHYSRNSLTVLPLCAQENEMLFKILMHQPSISLIRVRGSSLSITLLILLAWSIKNPSKFAWMNVDEHNCIYLVKFTLIF